MVPMKMYTILYNKGHQLFSDKVRKENIFILNSLQKTGQNRIKIPITWKGILKYAKVVTWNKVKLLYN